MSVFIITELDSKRQSAEARCKVLEKQLVYMRKMVENAERNVLAENQVVQKLTNLNRQMLDPKTIGVLYYREMVMSL